MTLFSIFTLGVIMVMFFSCFVINSRFITRSHYENEDLGIDWYGNASVWVTVIWGFLYIDACVHLCVCVGMCGSMRVSLRSDQQ
jgi:hypothetical protein